jgi:hypothetical protein
MTTPYGSFSDVVRVHEFSITTDSVFVKSGPVTLFSMLFSKDTTNKYLFWANNERHPVAIAYCSNAGVLQRIEYVSWAHLNVPQVEANKSSVKVFPNPTSDHVTIQIPEVFKNETYSVQVFDLSGKSVANKSGRGSNISISMKGFDQGMYIVEIKTETGVVFKSEITVK